MVAVGEFAKAAVTPGPPPGVKSDAVKAMYWAEDAKMALDVTRGVGRVAGKLISQRLAQTIGRNVIVKTTQSLVASVRAQISKVIAWMIAKMLGRTVATAGATVVTTAAPLASAGPPGWILEAVLAAMQVMGILFLIFDKSGITFVMDNAFIKNLIDGMNKSLDDEFKKAGMPGYYSSEATFPVSDFIFKSDDKGGVEFIPGWGDTYLKFQDQYMASKGFSANWRDSIVVPEQEKPETKPKPELVIFIGIILLFFCTLVMGGIYYIATM